MVVGLKDENDVLFDGNYNTKQRRKWMPILADFVSEIKRRKLSMGQKPKANSQMKIDAALNWLIQNLITDEQDKEYILGQMKTFMTVSMKVDESNLMETVTQQLNDAVGIKKVHRYS